MKVPWSVEELVPHSRTMLLLDSFVAEGEDWVEAGVRIAEDCLFYDPDIKGIPAWIGLEYMAQTVALYSGLQARRAGEAVKLGFLLGTRRFEASKASFVLGSFLTIRAAREWDDGQMAVFDCSVSDEKQLASARINAYLPQDVEAFLAGEAP
ncbi:ApeP family dehydratase [Pelagibius marinus]|uniref:ApeP family dehydratase n=1 Tax=Pelagibius marinus TaxID=2762760 RepID=UPI0018722245|nr:hypothetical protein [Pelagibius marinus]